MVVKAEVTVFNGLFDLLLISRAKLSVVLKQLPGLRMGQDMNVSGYTVVSLHLAVGQIFFVLCRES